MTKKQEVPGTPVKKGRIIKTGGHAGKAPGAGDWNMSGTGPGRSSAGVRPVKGYALRRASRRPPPGFWPNTKPEDK